MKTYCFRCQSCGYQWEASDSSPVRQCLSCGGYRVIRDYRAEAVNVAPVR